MSEDREHRLTERLPSRRDVLSASAGLAALHALGIGLFPSPAWARGEADRHLDDRRRAAVKRGCKFLKSAQHKTGAWSSNNTDRGTVALTALAVLALMADGSTDGRGPYGAQVAKGIDFLLALVEVRQKGLGWHEGYFFHAKDQSSRMHGQGFATLALASALGTSSGKRYRRIRKVLEKAVACIEQAQTQTGGFGYDPVPSESHEGSVTVTVAQGLRAARDAGLSIDKNVVVRGLNYLERCQKSDGSFRYSQSLDRSSYALTGAAISSFFLYGRYVDLPRRQTIQRGLDYIIRQVKTVMRTRRWYYYGHFYSAWALWQKDGNEWDPRSGGYWARWHRIVYPDLLEEQKSDGSWADDNYAQFDFGPVLATSFAVLTLAIPDEMLPVFQR